MFQIEITRDGIIFQVAGGLCRFVEPEFFYVGQWITDPTKL